MLCFDVRRLLLVARRCVSLVVVRWLLRCLLLGDVLWYSLFVIDCVLLYVVCSLLWFVVSCELVVVVCYVLFVVC